MLTAMMSAKAGDMVLGEDPTVNALEKKIASMFGKEDAAFCPSGTMTNQIAVNVHTRPGDEVICSRHAHIYLYEGGGIAFNSGASVSLVDSDDGTFTSGKVLEHINADDHHKAHTSLVCIENTVNMGGGKIWKTDELKKIKEVCDKHSLNYHLDGARIFNALVETKTDPKTIGKLFDSISVCFSKGLGAPVGSALLGSEPFIKQTRRKRKVLGGTMRQAGYLAAAGLYALENNIERLVEDHILARQIESALSKCNWIKYILPVETNIIIFAVDDTLNQTEIIRKLSERGILISSAGSKRLRIVTHLNVTHEMSDFVCKTLPGII
jgi:threonine aldolase